MTTIQIELPDATARAAQEAGLLTPQALEWLLTDALRRKRLGSFPPPCGAKAEPALESGKAKAGLWNVIPGKFWMASDFDEPLEDFKEYME